ncbi:MAG: hypothetical protein LBI65_01980, partial [Candidatus Symbiothrix sp.]|nr:hypothetical protein [Candidatus Symbiothrix sp.]
MKTAKLFLLLALLFFSYASLYAQVTIGGLEPPKAGALLDLNSTTRGGLLLSNVSLNNLYTIPYGNANLFPGIDVGSSTDNDSFKGAIIYNTNPQWSAGTYLWNGKNWTPVG